MKIRFVSFAVLAVLAAGCASQSATPGTAAPSAAEVAAQGDPELVAAIREAAKRGYKIVNQDGQTLYCREETKTGSRVHSTVTCLNAQQLRALQQNSQRNVEQLQRTPQALKGG
jgi:hypothetical protein